MTADRRHVRRLLLLTLMRLDSHVPEEAERAESDLVEALFILQTLNGGDPVARSIRDVVGGTFANVDDPKKVG